MRIIRIGESRVNIDAIKAYMPAYMQVYNYYGNGQEQEEEEEDDCDTPRTDAHWERAKGKTEIQFCDGTSKVVDLTPEELDALIAEASGEKRLEQTVGRLIQAMDRMTVHFPTSIKMHM